MYKKSTVNTQRRLALLLLAMAAPFFYCPEVLANGTEKLDVGAAAEYKFSNIKRDPAPILTSNGNNLSQEYRLYLDGSILNQGLLDSSFGVMLPDKYRPNDVNYENQVDFDYGKWLHLGTLAKNETDEDIFFSGTTEPQSPINTATERYDAKLMLNRGTSLQVGTDKIERNDVLLGTVLKEETKGQRIKFSSSSESLTIDAEHRPHQFRDKLGTRSDIDSEDTKYEVSYSPRENVNFSGYLDSGRDTDIDNNTRLTAKGSGLEAAVKLFKSLKFRDRLKSTRDSDTKTGEDITTETNEIIVNYDPYRFLGFEAAYKFGDEDKQRTSVADITSSIDEKRFRLKLSPIAQVTIQPGYEIYNKESTLSTENSQETKIYTDFSFQPVNPLRVSMNIARLDQKDTASSAVKSETSSEAVSVQYHPGQGISVIVRYDTNETLNPETDSFTKTDTFSSSMDVDITSYFNVLFRNSAQQTTGSSEGANLERLLNSLEFNVDLLKNLRLTTEYEIVDASGVNSADEKLFDTSIHYFVSKFDFSLRFQDRTVTGATPSDKRAVLSNIKYKFNQNAALSLKGSWIDYVDEMNAANSYNSRTLESSVSMRF